MQGFCDSNQMKIYVDALDASMDLSWLLHKTVEEFKVFKSRHKESDGEINAAGTVIKTQTLTRADFPGIRDCDNAVWMTPVCSSNANPIDTLGEGATLTGQAVHRLWVNGAHSDHFEQNFSLEDDKEGKSERRSILMPFNGNGEIVVTHEADSFLFLNQMEDAQIGSNIRVFGYARVVY